VGEGARRADEGTGNEVTTIIQQLTRKTFMQKLKKYQKQLREKETLPEHLLWHFIRDRKLEGFKFRRQQTMLGYIVDFVCYEKNLIIELDGEHHAEQEDYDNSRTEKLENAGFYVLRFWNEQVLSDLGGVLYKIEKHLTDNASLISPSRFAQFHLDRTRPPGTFAHKERRKSR
jgi:very-short-patch-repair endonuclease